MSTMHVLLGHPVDPASADRLGEALVRRRHGTTVADPAHVLGRIERVRDRGTGARGEGAAGLRRVFDDGEAEVGDRTEIDRSPVEVHGHDRSCASGDRRLDALRVDERRLRIDVDGHRPRSGGEDRRGGGNRSERRNDDLVAGTDAERRQRDLDGGRPARDTDELPSAERGGGLGLERRQFRSEEQRAAVHDPRHGVQEVRLGRA